MSDDVDRARIARRAWLAKQRKPHRIMPPPRPDPWLTTLFDLDDERYWRAP